ncbi:MAG: hypothetical protein ACRCUE_00960 [Bosea sp. (in: a-proteobacteria)]
MNDFRIRMFNKIASSRCEAPGDVLHRPEEETLIVTLESELLTISDTGMFRFPEAPNQGIFAANFRIYARLRKTTGTQMHFDMLEKVPGHPDVLHFEVLEKYDQQCVLTNDGGIRRLHAYGVDDGNVPFSKPGRSSCRGWVFDATEV